MMMNDDNKQPLPNDLDEAAAAELKGVPEDQFAKQMLVNAHRVFPKLAKGAVN